VSCVDLLKSALGFFSIVWVLVRMPAGVVAGVTLWWQYPSEPCIATVIYLPFERQPPVSLLDRVFICVRLRHRHAGVVPAAGRLAQISGDVASPPHPVHQKLLPLVSFTIVSGQVRSQSVFGPCTLTNAWGSASAIVFSPCTLQQWAPSTALGAYRSLYSCHSDPACSCSAQRLRQSIDRSGARF